MNAVVLALFASLAAQADWERVTSQPNLERRAHAALGYADEEIKKARETYQTGDPKATAGALDEMAKAVEFAAESLKGTGKSPSRSPKHFKYAEQKTRELQKRLDAFALEMDYADRGMTESVKQRLGKVHDALLLGIMGKK